MDKHYLYFGLRSALMIRSRYLFVSSNDHFQVYVLKNYNKTIGKQPIINQLYEVKYFIFDWRTF